MLSCTQRKAGDLVEQAVVTGRAVLRFRAEFRGGQKAEHAETVVERYDDKPVPGQRSPVVERLGARAHDEPAAVDPHQNRPTVRCPGRRRPHVEGEAVLAHLKLLAPRGLRAHRTEALSASNARPTGGRSRRAPTQRAAGRRRVGDALEHGHLRQPTWAAGDQARLGRDRLAVEKLTGQSRISFVNDRNRDRRPNPWPSWPGSGRHEGAAAALIQGCWLGASLGMARPNARSGAPRRASITKYRSGEPSPHCHSLQPKDEPRAPSLRSRTVDINAMFRDSYIQRSARPGGRRIAGEGHDGRIADHAARSRLRPARLHRRKARG